MASTPITQFIRRERGLAASARSIPAIQPDRKPRFDPCPELRGPRIAAVTIIDTATIADQALVTTALTEVRSALEAFIK